jgi:cell division protein FtsB
MVEKQKSTLNRELQEEIKRLKKRIKDLERERDILLALHRKDTDWEK